MKIYLANTDNKWFDFLRERAPWSEINFWKPTQQIFKAIDEGGIFAFRLKSPRNVIGGYGTFVSSINAPIKFAWDSLGEANGVRTVEDMVSEIGKYRQSRDTTAHSLIGCRLLSNPIFFSEPEWFDVPGDWSTNIVTGKVYDSSTAEGQKLLRNLEDRTNSAILFEREERNFRGFSEEKQARFGAPVSVLPRLGQGSFRIKVAASYNFSCAISQTRVLPALEAAHIIPYAHGGSHDVANGILLRKDIHSVFDAGFAAIDDEFRFVVSSKVKDIFNNGNEYFRLSGSRLNLPDSRSDWPSLEYIRWHREKSYLG